MNILAANKSLSNSLQVRIREIDRIVSFSRGELIQYLVWRQIEFIPTYYGCRQCGAAQVLQVHPDDEWYLREGKIEPLCHRCNLPVRIILWENAGELTTLAMTEILNVSRLSDSLLDRKITEYF